MYKIIFPLLELQDAMIDHTEKPYDKKKLIHLEALLHELLDNVRKEVIKRGLSKQTKKTT